MQNNKAEVVAALRRAYHNVQPIKPDDDAELPCVSYMESDNSDFADADDAEYAQREEYTIDLWGETTTDELSEIALDINREMVAIGFKRMFCTDVPPDDLNTIHKTMIYERVI